MELDPAARVKIGVTCVEYLIEILKAAEGEARVDIVELKWVEPLVFSIVNLKAAVRWDTGGTCE